MIKSSFLIAGKHAVTEALKNPNRKVLRVFLTEESKKKLNSENQNKHLLKNVKILYKTNKELDRLCSKDQISHQGLIAEIIPLEEANIKEYLTQNSEKKCITFAAIEGVTDPRNIGSIIRSASSFDIDGIIVVQRSYPDQSKLLYKSASGCIELLNIFEVSNINTTLKYLKSKNFWISGFDSQSKNDFLKHNWDGNNVLLFGSEGYGLKYQTKKNSDFLLKININKNVESLNISNSASIIFHHLHQIKKIIIITGKGLRSKNIDNPYVSKDLSILKNSVPDYINTNSKINNKIKGISKAEIKDGGEGAFYIFLKKLENKF